MIKIVQFGEGNFLRTFVDAYFEALNKEEGNDYRVNIIKPIPFGNLDKFKKQNNIYHIVLRGVKDGNVCEDVYQINCIDNVISPFEEYDKYISFAADKDLKIIVSNTTEAGICFNENDKIEDFEKVTYPAKLTKFLYERFKLGLDGLYIMPVELIDNNADELYKCVDKYISLWHLPKEFKIWNDEKNFYCNTLVDRIVSGYPKDEETKKHLFDIIGKEDELVSIGEPFGLWVVENKGEIGKLIKSGKHNIDVILTDDIKYYKKRKVRVLNGSHTNLVPYGLFLGKETVYDCMIDPELSSFVESTLKEEIIPFVSSDILATTEFASHVKERFLNPYLNHQLISIALNSISKWRARNLPSFKDYYEKYGIIPKYMAKGFGYLMALYKSVEKTADGKYIAKLPHKTIEIKDELEYLDYFASGGCVVKFMQNEKIWGEDLTLYNGFVDAVKQIVSSLVKGKTCEHEK